MLRSLVATALSYRLLVLILAAATAGLGVWACKAAATATRDSDSRRTDERLGPEGDVIQGDGVGGLARHAVAATISGRPPPSKGEGQGSVGRDRKKATRT